MQLGQNNQMNWAYMIWLVMLKSGVRMEKDDMMALIKRILLVIHSLDVCTVVVVGIVVLLVVECQVVAQTNRLFFTTL